MPSLMQRATAKVAPEDQAALAPEQMPEQMPEQEPEAVEPADNDGDQAQFTKPDIARFIPEDMRDIVDRVVAAGHKMIYSEQMREQVAKEIQRDVPVAQKLGEAVVGLLLTLDSKTPSGIPQAAIFPAAVELLAEAAEILSASGQPVTQEDFNEAMRTMWVLIGKKLGASDADIMQMTKQAASAQAAPGAGAPVAAPPAVPVNDGWED